MSQLKEDLTIAKQTAVTKMREEMNRERDESLEQQRIELESQHEVVVKEVRDLLDDYTNIRNQITL